MKTILFLIVLLGLVSCCESGGSTSNVRDTYVNEKFVIVKSNEPQSIKVWLILRINSLKDSLGNSNDTVQYAELSSNDNRYTFKITNELWYNKGVGDTLYFDYILASRFFNAKRIEDSPKIKTNNITTTTNTYYKDMSKIELKILIGELEKLYDEK